MKRIRNVYYHGVCLLMGVLPGSPAHSFLPHARRNLFVVAAPHSYGLPLPALPSPTPAHTLDPTLARVLTPNGPETRKSVVGLVCISGGEIVCVFRHGILSLTRVDQVF